MEPRWTPTVRGLREAAFCGHSPMTDQSKVTPSLLGLRQNSYTSGNHSFNKSRIFLKLLQICTPLPFQFSPPQHVWSAAHLLLGPVVYGVFTQLSTMVFVCISWGAPPMGFCLLVDPVSGPSSCPHSRANFYSL